ncbi:MAG: ATP-binding protein [Phaeodactylibacter sp.]|nr:ATP-binding protein [Phaeodactylibacter sp.]
MSQPIKNKIYTLIEEGKTLDVLYSLKEIFSKTDRAVFREIVLLISRWNDIEKKHRIGVVPSSDAAIEKNRISNAALEYFDKLPGTLDGKKNEIEKKLARRENALAVTRFLLFCAILAILFFLSFFYYRGSLSSELSYPQESTFGFFLYGLFAMLPALFIVLYFLYQSWAEFTRIQDFNQYFILASSEKEEPETAVSPYEKYSAKIKEVVLELENYEFFHSPYAFDKPDQKFLGRRDVIGRLKMILTESDTKSGAYLVTGFRGMGKTSIVRKAIAEINEERERLKEIPFFDPDSGALCLDRIESFFGFLLSRT